MSIKVNTATVYHCAVQFCSIFSLLHKTSICFMGWKAIPVTKTFNFVCFHTRWIIAIVANKEIMAPIKKKNVHYNIMKE